MVQQKAIPQTASVAGGPEEHHMKLADEGSLAHSWAGDFLTRVWLRCMAKEKLAFLSHGFPPARRKKDLQPRRRSENLASPDHPDKGSADGVK